MDAAQIFIAFLLAANLVGLTINGVHLAQLLRGNRRNARELEDLRARIEGEPRNPFPLNEG